MSDLLFSYSCGHQDFDPEYQPGRIRMKRYMDRYCDSCQKDGHLHEVQNYANELEKLEDEEWDVHKNAFFTLIDEIETGNPDWTYEAVAIEAERQVVEAFKARQPRVIPEIVKTPPPESAEDQGRQYPPEWVKGENDEIVRDNLHPAHAWLIIDDLEMQQSPSREPEEFDFDAEDAEDAEDVEDCSS